MPIFQYTATDQTGAPSEGNFEAASEDQAMEQLAQYGLTVTKLEPVGSADDESKKRVSRDKKQKKGLFLNEEGGWLVNSHLTSFFLL